MNIIITVIIPTRLTEQNKTAHSPNYNSEAERAKSNFEAKRDVSSTAGET
jgi:hypothetical protein